MSTFTSVTIGDSISIGLEKAYPNSIETIKNPALSKVGERSSWLITQLKSSKAYTQYKKVVLSIGSNEGWSTKSEVKDELILMIRKTFPNAELFILNGNWGWSGLATSPTKDDNSWKQSIDSFIQYFVTKGFKVIGKKAKVLSHPAPGDELFRSFDEDLKKYSIIGTNNNTAANLTQQAQIDAVVNSPSVSNPVVQESSRGEIAGTTVKRESDIKNTIAGKTIVNLFPANFQFPRIVIPAEVSKDAKNEFIRGMGYLPMLFYNNLQIDNENLTTLQIAFKRMVPVIKASFYDYTGLIRDLGTPTDNTKIKVFIYSRSEKLRSIFLQFKILEYKVINNLVSIYGTLDVNELYVKTSDSYKDVTSNKVLQEICSRIGLGFNTNVVETFDKMNWLNTKLTLIEFIRNIIKHSYISDESFLSGGIDLYYNLNFIDIQKELSRDIDQEIGETTTGLQEILGIQVPNNTGDRPPLFLTNDESLASSNSYFSKYTIKNRSTNIALKKGYSDNIIYYDTDKKQFFSFEIHSLNGNVEKSIVLKGATLDDDFFEKNKNYKYGGKYTPDNSHMNYNYAKAHNLRNLLEVEKLVIDLELPFPNFQIYKYQQLKLIISDSASTAAVAAINPRYTGEWLVVSIRFTMHQGKFKQHVTLVKRELQLSKEELDRLRPKKKGAEGKSFWNPISNSQGERAVVPAANPQQSNQQPVQEQVNQQNEIQNAQPTENKLSVTDRNGLTEEFVSYMAHQQGDAGIKSILYYAFKEPKSLNGVSEKIQRNMSFNIGSDFLTKLKLQGKQTPNKSGKFTYYTFDPPQLLSPNNFIKYWLLKFPEKKAEAQNSKGAKRFRDLFDRLSKKYGVSLEFINTTVMIESGFNPNSGNGKYNGLFQLSKEEFEKKYPGQDIFDAEKNADVGVALLKTKLNKSADVIRSIS